jgi:RimJ/RimL family protein N-acetyltransferase
LRAAGLELRALTTADVPALFEIFGDPEVVRYWSVGPLESLAAAATLLHVIEAGFAERELFQWGITEPDTGQVIGTCTLHRIELAHRRCEIGFALRRDRWGQGRASAAVSAVLGFAFDTLGCHRVEADADPRNARSLALLERLGFEREGLLKERYHVAGEIQDALLLGLLRSRWLARAGAAEDGLQSR